MAISKSSIDTDNSLTINIGQETRNLKEKIENQKNYLFAKRAMDLIGSLTGIILLSPVFIVIALLIKLEDRKGSIIFKQLRVGKDGKQFYIYKFRSMVTNAEELLDKLLDKNETTGAMFKMKNDPRVTRIGHFIRKTSIDELPQLFNVLVGNMSLVGPRPPLPREVEKYSNYDKQRLLVTPGCTGLWQVSGRSNVGFKKMVKLDLEYIENRSFILDIRIIIQTMLLMLWSKNAF
ncbi:sugar transferase [Sporolactobacillus inulinus]|uniref:Multidrug MFS transporter n=1 Tax=Sporolactobacillus inulinus CASD TaxID=1069536 RepID=A0A0U1QKQ3_9BACL|nr:exopolysaccharide biosynthesis polyprenyl glycosylphosphotransferase [Sporolactobacillus inulinus]KLI01387.1 multidrug MFS transporter [Sporolactobacillus inulinus CASD]GEB77851.1 multidrug MFS transporter [Sporolactobacillus inulinus]